MKKCALLSTILTRASSLLVSVCSVGLLTFSNISVASSAITLIDDFSHENNNSLGLPRQFMNDTMVGGKTQTKKAIKNGVLRLSGEIIPPRGQPGWASMVLLLGSEGKPIDASENTGIRMRIRINSGSLSISANSTEVVNFDYHSSVIAAPLDGQFHDLKIPFELLKRTWSEQTDLNTATINSVSLVAFSIQSSTFDYEIDEVSFY